MSNNIGKLAGSGAKARVLPITRQNGGTRMNIVGRSEVRVDAFDKATGRTKYYDDLAPKDALLVRIKHSTIAHGFVKSVDISKAEKIPGVVKILTCFDVPDITFPTAGHPWSMDPSHQDIADRHLLNRHVRYYGDDVCAVIAEDEVAAMQAVRAIEVEYEELPFVLDVQKAMESGAPQLHEKFPNNILKHTTAAAGFAFFLEFRLLAAKAVELFFDLGARSGVDHDDEGARDEAQEHHGDQHQADDPAAGAAVFGFHKCGYLPVYTFRNLRMESKLPNTPTRKPVSA